MSDLGRIKAEARELYPDAPANEVFWINELRGAFIAGRTVTAEQVEEAAIEIYERLEDEMVWQELDGIIHQAYRETARAAFRAAGLLIEEDQ